ncbi:MAG: NAD(P)(+) transhydrogenase (Re/Si-specific) subunit alpha, partial [Inquilinus limosus]|nr:NAD(P)(+) transhydrogenase (Re/Si-specific) subunit alpha [Inquilinus limosus]
MRIGVLRERRDGERRVAATVDSVKKLVALGATVVVETGAGLGSAVTDEAYRSAGAEVAPDAAAALAGADVVLKVRRPLRSGEGEVDELSLIPRGATLIGILEPYDDADSLAAYAEAGIESFALEL